MFVLTSGKPACNLSLGIRPPKLTVSGPCGASTLPEVTLALGGLQMCREGMGAVERVGSLLPSLVPDSSEADSPFQKRENGLYNSAHRMALIGYLK